jgi:hypothetical protein
MQNVRYLRFVNYLGKDADMHFKIHIDKSELRNTPTDNHLLKSNYFKFDNISYSISKLDSGKSKLILNFDYTLNSKMNFYAKFGADEIFKDFEEKLLEVLKYKVEEKNAHNFYI